MSILYSNSYNLVSMPWKMNQSCSNVHQSAEDVVVDDDDDAKFNLVNLRALPTPYQHVCIEMTQQNDTLM
jgi:hypothetical protein